MNAVLKHTDSRHIWLTDIGTVLKYNNVAKLRDFSLCLPLISSWLVCFFLFFFSSSYAVSVLFRVPFIHRTILVVRHIFFSATML